MAENVSTQTLQEIDFLRGFAPDHLKQIADIAQLRNFKKHEVVFNEGQRADNLYLIVKGSVLLEVGGTEIGCKHILTISKGELFGWSSQTEDPRYAAKAIAVEPLEVVQIDGARMRKICDSDPKFGYQFLHRTMLALSKRLVATWKQLADVYVPHYVPMSTGVVAHND
jgi:CRP-like cAMP-binding protein